MNSIQIGKKEIQTLKLKVQERDRQETSLILRKMLDERRIPHGPARNDRVALYLTDLAAPDGSVEVTRNLEELVGEKIQARARWTSGNTDEPVSGPRPDSSSSSYDDSRIRPGMSAEDVAQGWKAIEQALKPRS